MPDTNPNETMAVEPDEMANPNETIYDDPARGTISCATSAKLAINIQGVELSGNTGRGQNG